MVLFNIDGDQKWTTHKPMANEPGYDCSSEVFAPAKQCLSVPGCVRLLQAVLGCVRLCPEVTARYI